MTFEFAPRSRFGLLLTPSVSACHRLDRQSRSDLPKAIFSVRSRSLHQVDCVNRFDEHDVGLKNPAPPVWAVRQTSQ